ncbi:MAG TPA: T9SS type A sorting domain-containing protein [Bacteroidia bacterium]|nr:T9SS type A sorting domain-containing protein [Bacteroidia bacterium]
MYPNPAVVAQHIDFEDTPVNGSLMIIDFAGKVVFAQIVDDYSAITDLQEIPAEIDVLEVANGDEVQRSEFIKL